VKSAIEAGPDRPQPLSLTPPSGSCGSSATVWLLTCTAPESIRWPHLKAGEGAGAAGLGGEERYDLVPAPVHDVGGAQEQGLFRGRRQFGPGRKGGRGCVHRPGGISAGTGRDPGHDRAPVRVEVIEQPVRADPFTADVLLVLAQRSSWFVLMWWRKISASLSVGEPALGRGIAVSSSHVSQSSPVSPSAFRPRRRRPRTVPAR